MRVGRKAKAERVPVRLAARVTEVGTVELWCQSRTDDRRWRLQIQLRGPGGQPRSRRRPSPGTEADRVIIEQSELDAAIAAIRTAFAPGGPARGAGPVPAGQAAGGGPRRPPRPVAPLGPPGALGAAPRRWPSSGSRAARHESRWFNLAGFCLRPGDGLPARRDRGSRPSGRSSTRASATPRTSSAGPSGGSSGGGWRPA